MTIIEQLETNKIIAILRNVPSESVIETVSAIAKGGIKFFEVTLNSKNALEDIKRLNTHFGDTLCIGAGTVTNKEECQAANEAGAKFMLTPGIDKELLVYAQQQNILLFPGILTPSEAMMSKAHGFTYLKVFPAMAMPNGYAKQLTGPLNTLSLMAVGGVSLENIEHYMTEGYVGFGIGGQLANLETIKNKDWNSLSNYAAALVAKVSGH